MGTNWPEHLDFTEDDLLNTPIQKVKNRKGVGQKAIFLRYERLREIALKNYKENRNDNERDG